MESDIRKGASRAGLAILIAVVLSACSEMGGPRVPSTLQNLSFDTLFVVGASAGEPWETYGGIWDVAGAPDGTFAVLDIEETGIHVFDEAGNHVGSLVEIGNDPGMLRRPRNVVWGRIGELSTWDPGSSFISTFSVTTEGIEFLGRERAFAFGETGFCAFEDRRFLSFWGIDGVIHEAGVDGALVQTFVGFPDVAGFETLTVDLQDIAMEELTASRLVCLPEGVLDVSFFQSRMQLHDYEGSLLWSREIADFTPVVAYGDGIGLGLRYAAESGGSHLLRSTVPWGDAHVLVQYELRADAMPDPDAELVIESMLVRVADGVEVDRTRELPLFLGGYGNRLYEVRQEPFPQVIVLQHRG